MKVADATGVVVVNVRDLEELAQPRDHAGVALIVHPVEGLILGPVELDGQLVDLPQRVVGHGQQRLPFRAFDVNLQHDARRMVAVPGELVLHRIEEAPVDGFGRVPDAFRVKDRVAEQTPRPRRVEAIVLVTVTSCFLEISQPHPS